MKETPKQRDSRTTLHNVRGHDVAWLVSHFATLGPKGWSVPEWLQLMERTTRRA